MEQDQPPTKPNETYYASQRRQEGLNRLAVHRAFEDMMAEVDAGRVDRSEAIQAMGNVMRVVAPDGQSH